MDFYKNSVKFDSAPFSNVIYSKKKEFAPPTHPHPGAISFFLE